MIAGIAATVNAAYVPAVGSRHRWVLRVPRHNGNLIGRMTVT